MDGNGHGDVLLTPGFDYELMKNSMAADGV
jgi:hypothetical protein